MFLLDNRAIVWYDRKQKGKSMKVYFCDVCQEEITEKGCPTFETGWLIPGLQKQYTYFHVHSGRCLELAEKALESAIFETFNALRIDNSNG
jgi:hypothetical protein